jgi:hypothetical protein
MKITSTASRDSSAKKKLKLPPSSWLMRIFLSIVFLLIITFVVFILLFAGARLQQNQTAASTQQMLFDATKTRLQVLRNYVTGITSDSPSLQLDISFEDMQLLNAARETSLTNGKITDEEQSIEIKANLFINNEKFSVKLSPTGYNLDMIGDAQKRAFKVSGRKSDKPFGFSEFKLLPPKARHNLVEWVGHELEKQEGLITLQYFFVTLKVNGDNWGVYAVEEHFAKELLERNGAREGLIFTVKKNGETRIFNEKKYRNSVESIRRINLIKSAFKEIMSGNSSVNIESIIDVEKFARHLALLELMDSAHAVENNTFLYFNPLSNLVEPITREYNSLRVSEGSPLANRFLSKSIVSDRNLPIFRQLFKNDKFNSHFVETLERISHSEYLDNFFLKIQEQLEEQQSILYKQYPFYYFPKEYMYARQKQIRDILSNNQPIHAVSGRINDRIVAVTFENAGFLPIKLLRVNNGFDEAFHALETVINPGARFTKKLTGQFEHQLDLTFDYKVHNSKTTEKRSTITPKSSDNGLILPQFWHSSLDSMLKDERFSIDEKNKEIKFITKNLQLNETIIIPAGYVIVGKPGLTIDLINGASIISRSPIRFLGTENEPISVKSSDFTGGGLYVSGKHVVTHFTYVNFYQLTYPQSAFSGLTASLTIFEANVVFEHCTFVSNKSEDFLNVFQSKYVIKNSFFNDVFSDALDSDFSTGQVENTEFKNVGNDALDFSGSEARLDNINILSIGDKGISAGENSFVSGSKIKIFETEIGLTSKDRSRLIVDQIELLKVKLGIAVFKKKEEFGGAHVEVIGYKSEGVKREYLVDLDSSLIIEGDSKIDKVSDVESELYGVNYGKSSK